MSDPTDRELRLAKKLYAKVLSSAGLPTQEWDDLPSTDQQVALDLARLAIDEIEAPAPE